MVVLMKKVRPIRIEGDVAYITLTKGYEAVIDVCDAPLVGQYNWNANVDGGTVYAQRGAYADGVQKTTRMHRVLMGEPEGMEVDHRDGNGLNNRRSNLRIATKAQNQQNKGMAKRNSSGFKGVSWAKRERKWQAQIRLNNKNYTIGRYRTPEDAHAAYCEASTRLHGEFARHN